MKVIARIVFLSFICFQSAYAASSRFPQEFMFLNKPIDPVCISNPFDDSQHGMVDLNKCGMAQAHYVFDGYNNFLKKQGYYGWHWKDLSDPAAPSTGSGYYKFWPAGDRQFWVVAYFDGGGTGDFSTVNLFTRKDYHTVQMVTVSSGDRCNGGVVEANLKGKNLMFSMHITPADFFNLAEDANKAKTSEQVYGCASCCAANAFFEANKDGTAKFLYIDLGAHPDDNLPTPADEKYQVCFDKLLSIYVHKGKTKLNAAQLKQFVSSYHVKCG